MSHDIAIAAGETPRETLASPRRRTAGTALVASGIVFFLAEFIAASAWTDPPYSYTYHFISDLGVHGPSTAFDQYMYSPLAWVMNTGFVTFGVAALVGVLLLKGLRGARRWTLTAMAVLLAAGGVLVGLFPGSGEAIENGTATYHGLGAFGLFIGGNVLAILLGRRHQALGLSPGTGRICVVLGALGLVSLVAFGGILAAGISVLIGFFERGAVYLFLAAFITAGSALRRR
ncbi:DUF998 domain-containing protein [Actinoplanes sp. RD1]|uniref:DUF998 domain-containing protein n=1 Tax=Actinoplanes sp. RD1 TaxID=3064538 RepID=UPI002741C87F|nr:DUF998 domain-containing protein [Actinoplanes sp. RD1]